MLDKYLYNKEFYYYKDKNCRYLIRTVGEKPLICIGLNPSSATPSKTDNTFRRLQNIANFNDFDSIIVFNLYPFLNSETYKKSSIINEQEKINFHNQLKANNMAKIKEYDFSIDTLQEDNKELFLENFENKKVKKEKNEISFIFGVISNIIQELSASMKLKILFCWGDNIKNYENYKYNRRKMCQILENFSNDIYCLKRTKENNPISPIFMKTNTTLQNFEDDFESYLKD